MAKWGSLTIITKLLLLLNLAILALSNGSSSAFRAFYFIQQWLPSYCNQQGTICCSPATGLPEASFTIYGLWPYNDYGSCPEKCPGATFDVAPLKAIESMLEKEWPSLTCPQIGRKFWLHEWNKHGTCSKSVLDEISYFQAAFNLKNKVDILQGLAKAGIEPNDQLYPFESVQEQITRATGFRPFMFCNHDAQGNTQIWQVLHCVDKSGMELINCSNVPKGLGNCASSIKFPSFRISNVKKLGSCS